SARGLDHHAPAVTVLVTDMAGHQFCLRNRTAHRSATEHETSLLGALLRAQGSANTVTVDEVGPPTTVLVPQPHGHIRATRHFSCAQPSSGRAPVSDLAPQQHQSTHAENHRHP